jgi:hypothetical protein
MLYQQSSPVYTLSTSKSCIYFIYSCIIYVIYNSFLYLFYLQLSPVYVFSTIKSYIYFTRNILYIYTYIRFTLKIIFNYLLSKMFQIYMTFVTYVLTKRWPKRVGVTS